MKPRRATFMLAGSLALGLLAPGTALGEHEKDVKTSKSAVVVSGDRDKMLAQSNLIRASKVLDRPLYGKKGDDVAGRLMDIVVDKQDGLLAFAVIRLGGWDFDEATRFAVPISLIQETEGGRLRLNLSKNQMDKSLSFNKNSWPDMSDREWNKRIHAHFGVEPYWKQLDLPSRDDSLRRRTNREIESGRVAILDQKHPWVNRLAEMIGRPVSHRQEGDIAKIKDFVLDLKHGRVVYAVLENESATDKVALVPWSAIGPDGAANKFNTDARRETLRSVAFDEKKWPALTDPKLARDLHQKFNVDPYWTVFGFGGVTDFDEAWRAGSTYNKLYKPDHVKTLTGKVTKIDTFRIDGGGKGQMVTIKTDDGVEQVVHLGPYDYIERPNIRFHVRPGDEVTVTGSMVKHEGETIMMASRVRKGEDYLNLRSRSGVPAWDRSGTDESED